MHELAIAQSIVDLVAEQAARDGFTKVNVVRVRVGALSTVEPDALQFGFDTVTAGTIAAGARLILARPEGRGYCTQCMKDIVVAARGVACPDCGGHRWLVTSGDELTLENLEVD